MMNIGEHATEHRMEGRRDDPNLVSDVDISFSVDQSLQSRIIAVGSCAHDTGDACLSRGVRICFQPQEQIHSVRVMDGRGEEQRRFTPLSGISEEQKHRDEPCINRTRGHGMDPRNRSNLLGSVCRGLPFSYGGAK